MRNSIVFKLTGRHALFTDPLTRLGGERCSYHVPTYEALKGVAKSISWKPTFIWYITRLRIMRPIRTQSRGTKPIKFQGGNDLAIYTFLADVEYHVEAHFEWNMHRPELEQDRNEHKHFQIAKRMLERGGRQDIFLGTRDCQGYVEPCAFDEGKGAYDDVDELAFGLMFHGFDYPDETGIDELRTRFWSPVMRKGIIEFPRPEACKIVKSVRPMKAKKSFEFGRNLRAVDQEAVFHELD